MTDDQAQRALEIVRALANYHYDTYCDRRGRAMKCWCGVKDAYFEPWPGGDCGGTGSMPCDCGGDFCICHNHGEVDCPGCADCDGEAGELTEEVGEP